MAAWRKLFVAGALNAPARIAVRRSVRAWVRQFSQAIVMVVCVGLGWEDANRGRVEEGENRVFHVMAGLMTAWIC